MVAGLGSIPESPYNEFDEKQLLQSIKITHINNKPIRTKFTLDNIIEKYKATSGFLFVDMLIGDVLKRRYNVHVVHYQSYEDIIVNPYEFEHYFATTRTFIIDQFTMKFFDGFKNNNDISLYNEDEPFYILYNREMENDPANKPQLEDKHFENIGYCLEPVYDIDPRIVEYPKWNNNNLFYNTMFYSNYDIKL